MTYPRSPKLQKGALVKLSEDFLGPIPNIIVFQYNPETMTRSLTPSSASEEQGGRWGQPTTAEPFDPKENFDLALELDAADELEFPDENPVTVISGVSARISAMEMLLYPAGDNILGQLPIPNPFAGISAVPRGSVPIVLFVWGQGRILPVRLTSFQVEEQAFSPSLYPIRAVVTVGLQVLTEQTFESLGRELTLSEKLALTAYQFTRGQREVLAKANLATNLDSILSILPF